LVNRLKSSLTITEDLLFSQKIWTINFIFSCWSEHDDRCHSYATCDWLSWPLRISCSKHLCLGVCWVLFESFFVCNTWPHYHIWKTSNFKTMFIGDKIKSTAIVTILNYPTITDQVKTTIRVSSFLDSKQKTKLRFCMIFKWTVTL
jgi:hypothetical protein